MDAEHTPLQLKLNILAELIAKIGSIIAIVLCSSLMIRFIVQLATGQTTGYACRSSGKMDIAIMVIMDHNGS